MISVNIRELRKNLSKYIELSGKEPLEILKREKVVAILSSSNVYTKGEEKGESVHNVTEVKDNVYTETPTVKQSVHKDILKDVPRPRKICKVCGAGLNQYGDYCIGKGHHKQ